jgi:hypothetical protein
MALDVIDISAEGLLAYVVVGKPHRKTAARGAGRAANWRLFNGM